MKGHSRSRDIPVARGEAVLRLLGARPFVWTLQMFEDVKCHDQIEAGVGERLDLQILDSRRFEPTARRESDLPDGRHVICAFRRHET